MYAKNATEGINVNCWGGFMRGISLTGALHFLEEKNVKVATLTGASIGAVVAAAATNGYSPEGMKDLFVEDLHPTCIPAIDDWVPSILDPVRRLAGIGAVVRSLVPPVWDPIRLLGLGAIDLLPFFGNMIRERNLKPNDRLRVVTCTGLRRRQVIFQGPNIPLDTAVAGSCAIPGLFRPPSWTDERGNKMLLYDGAITSPRPLNRPSIVFKLLDNAVVNLIFPDNPFDFVASVGDQTQSLIGKLTEERADELFWKGYRAAQEALSEPLDMGLIPRHQ